MMVRSRSLSVPQSFSAVAARSSSTDPRRASLRNGPLLRTWLMSLDAKTSSVAKPVFQRPFAPSPKKIICGFGSPNSSQRFAMTSSGGHAPGSPRQSMYRDRSRVSSKYRVP